MEWIEAGPLPERCRTCAEEDCYNCDWAGERWRLSARDQLLLQKASLQKAIARRNGK